MRQGRGRARQILLAVAMVAAGCVAAQTSAAASPQFQWYPRQLHITTTDGVVEDTVVAFTYRGGEDVHDPRVVIAGPVADVLTVDVAAMHPTGNATFELPVTVAVPAGASRHLTGSLQVVDGSKPVGSALPVRVDVAAADGALPVGAAAPTPDRIGPGPQGVPVVVDELVVGVALDVPDPTSVAAAAADASGGQIIGSVTDLHLFQVRFPGADLDGTRSKIPVIEAVSGVDFAHLNVVDLDEEETIPNDPLWDEWNADNPAGNNWGLEAIGAPDAWDVTTGSSSTRIAVIDSDNDEDHGDLEGNVVSTSRGPKGSGHGTHVAGTACAEGDNSRGVTGVMWDCELRFYYYGGDAVSTVEQMLDAVLDDNRVVNMSLQFIENNTDVAITDEIIELVDDTNDIFARAVLYAQKNLREVLWVFAAGNETGRDVRFTAPGGLALRFPTTTMAVAAVGPDGLLAGFSNNGDGVSVAAPGVDIFSTVPREGCWIFTAGCDDRYDTKSGTSMAAPHVTGLAGLLFSDDPDRSAADVKSCIVGAAQRAGAPISGQPFHVIDAPAALECEGTIDLPAVVDVVLAFDLTGSMGGVLNRAKTQTEEAIAAIAAAAPDSDIRYSVVSYEDYPGFFDSTECGSAYIGTYGSAGDEPFRIDAAASGDAAAVQNAVRGLQLGGGYDGPESYGRALWEIAQPDTAEALGLRPGALVLIVNFGDNIPHDPDVNAGVEGASGVQDTGIDPGRNGTIDCGGDDIDFQDDALAELADAGIRLLHVDSGPYEQHWRTWASQTGGAYARLGGRSLSEVILELLALI